MDERTCVVCGAQFERRDGEPIGRYRIRKSCSMDCRRVLMSRNRKRIANQGVDATPHHCVICSEPVPRRRNEALSVWRSKFTCGRSACKVAARNATIAGGSEREYKCAECGALFVERSSKPRTYCSDPCFRTAKRNGDAVQKKPCVVCNTTISRPDGFSASRWQKLKTCGSRSCIVSTAVVASNARRAKTSEKKCITCGVAYTRRPREALSNFANRKACSKECSYYANTGRKTEISPKPCAACGQEFGPRENEKTFAFHNRVTCSRKCRGQWISERRRMGDYVPVYSRAWPYISALVRDRDGHVCQLCGVTPQTKKHAVHHIDYDKSNLSESNLVTLCHSCHAKTNHNRGYYQGLFFSMMLERGLIPPA